MKLFIAAVCLLALASDVFAERGLKLKMQEQDSAKPKAPCYVQWYNAFCYYETDNKVCQFYSTPSFATYAACCAAQPTKKCASCATKRNSAPTEVLKKCVDGPKAGRVDDPKAGRAAKTKATDAPTRTFKETKDSDIGAGADIPNDGKAFFQVCGRIETVKGVCSKEPKCKAFTYNADCGYLKSLAEPIATRKGWSVYTAV